MRKRLIMVTLINACDYIESRARPGDSRCLTFSQVRSSIQEVSQILHSGTHHTLQVYNVLFNSL